MGGLFSKKFDPLTNLQDLTGKIAIVTGGNTGVGYSIVKFLALRGAKVYLAARNESKATGALTRLEAEGVDLGLVVWLRLDLVDPRVVKKAAAEFMSKEDRLDILVNNAAMMITSNHEKTSDGISEMMSTNHIGPFVFVRELLPMLIGTAQKGDSDVRIVNLASASHIMVPNVRFRNLDDLNLDFKETIWPPIYRYGHSKITSIFFTKELQRRLDAEGIPIIVIAVHPGTVNTPELAARFPLPGVMKWFLDHFAPAPDEGAFTPLFAAASPAVRADTEKFKAKYLTPVGTVSKPARQTEVPELAKELWETTEAFLREIQV